MSTRQPELVILGTPTEFLLSIPADLRRTLKLRIARTPEELESVISKAEILFVLDHAGGWLEPCWEEARRLKWVHTSSTGVEDLLFPAFRESSILLTNSRGIYAAALGEFVLFSALFFAKNFAAMEQSRRERRWEDYPVRELRGATIGVVGLGETGRTVARLGKAFGMRVLATKRNFLTGREEGIVDELVPLERWHELLAASDYVVNALPLTPETPAMFGEREFLLMKPTACFINVGRGKTVQEAVLIQALKEGWIASAALDVFETEPLPADSELYSLPNVILSPHCADKTPPALEAVARAFAENLQRYSKSEPLLNVIDKQRGY